MVDTKTAVCWYCGGRRRSLSVASYDSTDVADLDCPVCVEGKAIAEQWCMIPVCHSRRCETVMRPGRQPGQCIVQHGDNPEAVFIINWLDWPERDQLHEALAEWAKRVHEYESMLRGEASDA